MFNAPTVSVRAAVGCAAILSLGLASSADGAFQTWTASGVITNLAESPGVTGGATTWSMVLTVDTSAPDLAPGDTSLGQYAVTFDLTVGSAFATLSGLMQVFDDPSGSSDQFAITADPQATGAWSSYNFQLLIAGGGSLLSSDGIPSTPPDPTGNYSEAIFNATYPDATGFQAYGYATSFVPSPGSAALLAMGGLLAARRRR